MISLKRNGYGKLFVHASNKLGEDRGKGEIIREDKKITYLPPLTGGNAPENFRRNKKYKEKL